MLFHFLLNGTKKGASGPLRIFETWFRPYRCADLLIDDSVFGMDAFGMDGADTQALLERLKALSNTEIRARARSYAEKRARRERLWSWLRIPRRPIVAAVDDDYAYLEDCFANLRTRGCEKMRADLGAWLKPSLMSNEITSPAWPELKEQETNDRGSITHRIRVASDPQ